MFDVSLTVFAIGEKKTSILQFILPTAVIITLYILYTDVTRGFRENNKKKSGARAQCVLRYCMRDVILQHNIMLLSCKNGLDNSLN